MIVLVHNTKKLTAIEADGENLEAYLQYQTLGAAVYAIAQQFPNKIIVWCHEARREEMNATYIKTAFPHNRYMHSFNTNGNYFPEGIGYVEDTPFIKVNKAVRYPTWQMSSEIGAMKASTILLIPQATWQKKQPFDFLLCSIAKLYQPLGLFCYSNPNLLQLHYDKKKPIPAASSYLLFKFVKQHYKWVWVFLLHLNYLIYEQKLTFFQLVCTFWIKKNKANTTVLDFTIPEVICDWEEETIDVIIPTIGRKKTLYDVLKDLNHQTHLPKKVIIVEQNPLETSVSDLDYLTSEVWNFEIEHVFTHQTGACNARNIALSKTNSKWVFMCDDDNRFDDNLIEEVIVFSTRYNLEVVSTAYPQVNENNVDLKIRQLPIFGSGNSFVKRKLINNVQYNTKFEFGYGEDADFGMQLRNIGGDVVFMPKPFILHLKAPMGGFRTRFIHPWENETNQPKPSPTVMLFRLLHHSEPQILGYKTLLFMKFYKKQSIKNPISYVRSMQKQWEISQKWANQLKTN